MINISNYLGGQGEQNILASRKNNLIIGLTRAIELYNGLPEPKKGGDISRHAVLLDAILHHAGYYLTSKRPQSSEGGKHKSQDRFIAIVDIAEQMGKECARLGITQLSGWNTMKEISEKNKFETSKYYWLEMLDPQHRHGQELSPLWVKWIQDDTAGYKSSFWDYIGTNSHPKYAEIEVKYFPEKAMNYQDNKYEVHFEGGILKDYQGNPVTTPKVHSTVFSGEGWAIFVCSASAKLYIGSHIAGEQHHSSFLGGGAVSGAGEIAVVNGRIRLITCKSGHYKPSGQLFRNFLAKFPEIPNDAAIQPDFSSNDWFLYSELRKANGGKPMDEKQKNAFWDRVEHGIDKPNSM